MPRYLVDVNLPLYFSLWNSPDFIHQRSINDEWTDEQIWDYAAKNGLTIISKDADFSHRVLLQNTPVHVIHIRIGNVQLRELFSLLSKNWDQILSLSEDHKLVTVFNDRIEAIT